MEQLKNDIKDFLGEPVPKQSPQVHNWLLKLEKEYVGIEEGNLQMTTKDNAYKFKGKARAKAMKKQLEALGVKGIKVIKDE